MQVSISQVGGTHEKQLTLSHIYCDRINRKLHTDPLQIPYYDTKKRHQFFFYIDFGGMCNMKCVRVREKNPSCGGREIFQRIINISQPPNDGLFIIKVSTAQKPPASEHNIHHLLAAQTLCSKNFIYQMTGKLIITAV